jgi:probable HAF family extracellular repeat protein
MFNLALTAREREMRCPRGQVHESETGLRCRCVAVRRHHECGERNPFFEGLGFLPGANYSQALGVSVDGSTVVGGNLPQSGQGGQAWVWTAATGMVGLGYLVPGYNYSVATAVNANGSVVVGIGEPSGGGYNAFRWTAATGMVNLGVSSTIGNNSQSYGYGVSADGSVLVGKSTGALGTQAFRWTAATGLVVGSFD